MGTDRSDVEFSTGRCEGDVELDTGRCEAQLEGNRRREETAAMGAIFGAWLLWNMVFYRRHKRVPASHTFATRPTTSSARLPLTIDDYEVNRGDEEIMYLI